MTDEIRTTEQMREWCADDGGLAEYRDPIDGHRMADYARREFDRWLAAHDAETASATAANVALRIRQNCTPSSDAYAKGGDFLVYAVADWVENPPEWVKAGWVSQQAEVVGENHEH